MLKLKIYKKDIREIAREVRGMQSWCPETDNWWRWQITLCDTQGKLEWHGSLVDIRSRDVYDGQVLHVKLRPWQDATYEKCLQALITEVDEKLIGLSEYSSEYGRDMTRRIRYYEALRAKLEELR